MDIEQLQRIAAPSDTEAAYIRNALDTQRPSFLADKDALAVFAFGGTVQSAYVPAHENIVPVPVNPALERIRALGKQFGIAAQDITGAILLAKDSREISPHDVANLVHTIALVPNERVLVTCGTYKLPLFAQVLDAHFGQGKSDKIIGVTGSMLPQIINGHDADVNIGGTIAALNAFAHVQQKGIVFAQFHGQIVSGEALKTLDLHRPDFDPRLAYSQVELR